MQLEDISSSTLKRLEERAAVIGCSVDELLNQLLDNQPELIAPIPYSALLDHTSDVIVVFDLELRHLYINSVIEKITGEPAKLWIGKTQREMGMPEDVAARWDEMAKIVIETKYDKVFSYHHPDNDGERYYESRLTPILNEHGDVQYLFTITRDVTTARRAEEALHRSELRLRKAQEVAGLGIWEFNLQTEEVIWSDEFFRICGMGPGSIIPTLELGLSLIHPDDRARAAKAVEISQQNGQPYNIEKRIVRPNGEVRWVISQGEITFDEHGKPHKLTGTFLDITERKQTEESLRHSEARLRTLLESQTAFVVRVALNETYSYANGPFRERYTWLKDNLIGLSIYETIVPRDHEKARAAAAACMANPGKPVQVVLQKQTPNNENFWTLWEFCAIQNEKGNIEEIQCIGFDITQQKEAEEALRESETRYRLLTELMFNYAISVRVEPDGSRVIEWVVGAFEEITGHPLDYYDRYPNQSIVYPEDYERHQKDMDRTMRGEATTSDYRIIHKKGHIVWLRATRIPIWDEEHQRIIRIYSVVQDITHYKVAEEIALEHQRLKTSLQKEKELNTLVQRMISSLSHDIRTPLTVISTSKKLLNHYFDKGDKEKYQAKVALIDRQINHVVEMLDDLVLAVKTSFNQRTFQKSVINIAALSQITIDEIRTVSLNPPKITLVNKADITTFEGDETLISRILLNLLSNAVKFSPVDSEVRLELEHCDTWMIIRVVDHGIGIRPEDIPHIFEPFYRADVVGHIGGTGLGLNIVKECVERHQGRISVESTPNEGAVFTVELPLHLPTG